jgi:hypothetical protein
MKQHFRSKRAAVKELRECKHKKKKTNRWNRDRKRGRGTEKNVKTKENLKYKKRYTSLEYHTRSDK